jgi:hypothetical protein
MKYNITNCSPQRCTIVIGLRHIAFGQTCFGIDESEINGAVKRLEASGLISLTPSVKAKSSLCTALGSLAANISKKTEDKSTPRPVPPKVSVPPPVKEEVKPVETKTVIQAVDTGKLKKFPWSDKIEAKTVSKITYPKVETKLEVIEPIETITEVEAIQMTTPESAPVALPVDVGPFSIEPELELIPIVEEAPIPKKTRKSKKSVKVE